MLVLICIPLNVCIGKDIFKISDLKFHLKKLEKEEQMKPKITRKKE